MLPNPFQGAIMTEHEKIPEDVGSIALRFLDLKGKTREIRVPLNMWEVVKEDGMSFDSSNVGFADVSESDMVAIPDPSTMKIIERNDEKIAAFICDIQWPDGSRFKGDPRYLLKKTMDELADEGMEIKIKPEYEFHILDPETKEPYDQGNYIDGRVEYTDMVGELTKAVERYDMTVEKIHHEAAAGQYEIEPLPYDDPLQAADDFMIIKDIVKRKVREKGAYATFMPKPVAKDAGNGFHVHMSLFKDSKYLFSADELNEEAAGFIGGLLNHAKALSAVVSPTINSYKRLIPGYEAPVYISWGGENRSVLVRIPAYGTEEQKKGRIEFRAGDATANIYLMLNSLIRAGMNGMKNSMDPGEEMKEDLFQLTTEEIEKKGIEILPADLGEALDELEKDEIIRSSLGESYEHYVRLKQKEVEQFNLSVTDWEMKEYIDY